MNRGSDRTVQLRPWLEALRDHEPQRPSHGEIEETGDFGTVRIRLSLTEVLASNFLLVHEALELLELLSCCDYDEWLRALMSIWPQTMTLWVNACHPKELQLEVQLCVENGGELARWAERAFLLDPALVATAEGYADVRSDLVAELGNISEPPEVCVPVCVVVENNTIISLLLFECLQLARMQTARSVAASAHAHRGTAGFRLVKVQVYTMDTRLTAKDLLYIEEITSCGVHVPRIPFVDVIEQATAVHTNPCLQRMIVAPTRHGNAPVRCVDVHVQAARQTLDGIFAAVLHSTTVGEVSLFEDARAPINEREENRERLLYWLALCAFGRDKCPSLDVVMLSEIQMADVQTLQTTLRDSNAFSELFPATTEREAKFTVEKASNFELADPNEVADAPEPSSVVLETPYEDLRVISIGDRWVSVLLPGWGQAWVQRSDVSLIPRVEASNAQPVDYLIFDGGDKDAVLAMVDLVGTSLRRLDISDVARLSEGVRAVCLACPLLEELTLTGVEASSLDVLGDCYEAGTCHVKRLILEVIHETDDVVHSFNFFTLLADENHPMTQHIRELHLKFHVPRVWPKLDRLIDAATKMLKDNRFLWNLSIRIKLPRRARVRDAPMFDLMGAHFMRYNGQNVALKAGPLAMDKKLAFLSVVQGSPLAICRFDAKILSLIFKYAAVCARRGIQVTAQSSDF